MQTRVVLVDGAGQRSKLWYCTLTYLSAAHQFLQLFRVASALHRDLCGCGPQFAEFVWRKLDIDRADVFFEPMQLGRAWDWHDPRLLRQQPSECDLSGCRFLLLCEPDNQIGQDLIRFPVLRRKARD